ncbi:coniferyl-aldehyde dehydrogenase [Cereibacter ovatus]|uniref:Aldehyde dehydrogenase n=2 Tax=Cereibacter ovatus TaxID=439529 RepID=A0A285CRG5_9RHOB|nr:coniferyl-aldehyde dehydrogenase [Cereibacter ovatus]
MDTTLLLDALRRAHLADPDPDAPIRIDRLRRLETALQAWESRLVAAIHADFGHRSAAESGLFDITLPIADIRFARRSLRRWMRPRRVAVPAYLQPAKALLRPQPLGVVGIIAPWNFPVYLTAGPLAMVLAAGNRAMVKPSELTPATADVLNALLTETFAPDEVACVTGGPDVAANVAALPFDHLVFTGSTAVGRKVAEAAARNLTPVTLELGGKSPAILAASADPQRAARRIAWGKLANAGQICIAPDYALVHRPLIGPFVDSLAEAMRRMLPEGAASADYGAIVSDRHRTRLESLLAEAEAAGARVIRPVGAAPGPGLRRMAPAIVLDPPPDLRLMQEEIFGPILPVIAYDSRDEALARVADGPRPLALYLFAEAAEDRQAWIARSLAGGMAVNDTLLHVACNGLPFGGVGASGTGSWHGEDGFRRFSHMKPVLIQSRLNGGFLMEPPFSGWKARALRIFRRIV